MELHWTLPHPYGKKVYAYSKLALEIQHEVQRLVLAHAPHLRDEFPFFSGRFHVAGDIGEGLIVVRLTANSTDHQSLIEQLSEPESASIHGLVEPTDFLTYEILSERLGTDWYSNHIFTYVGPCVEYKVSWRHIQEVVAGWFRNIALANTNRDNET